MPVNGATINCTLKIIIDIHECVCYHDSIVLTVNDKGNHHLLVNIRKPGAVKIVSATTTINDGYLTLLLKTNASSVGARITTMTSDVVGIRFTSGPFCGETYVELTNMPRFRGGFVDVHYISIDPDGIISVTLNRVDVDSDPVELIDYSKND